MEFREDLGTGYMYCYNPTHYCANKAGKVLEHVFVIAEIIGRPLKPDECVHHKDRDKKNNHPSNLKLMTMSEHAKLHAMEDRGVVYIDLACATCEIPFSTTQASDRKYCSLLCASRGKVRFEIDANDLELLVWSRPTLEVAVILGVTDVAVAKRCKKLGIAKPPRGYWAKLRAKA